VGVSGNRNAGYDAVSEQPTADVFFVSFVLLVDSAQHRLKTVFFNNLHKLSLFFLISQMLQPTLKSRRSDMTAVLWGWL
jgi:hypothetical protein